MGLYLSHDNGFDYLSCRTNVILLQETSVDHSLFHAETLVLSTCPRNISSSNYDDSDEFYFDDFHQTAEQEEDDFDHRLRLEAPPTSKAMPRLGGPSSTISPT